MTRLPVRIAVWMEAASSANERQSRLLVVAPERSLGEFRALAPDKSLRIAVEMPKELTQLSVHDLQARLNEFIGA
jgi:protein required for attachment to host cells